MEILSVFGDCYMKTRLRLVRFGFRGLVSTAMRGLGSKWRWRNGTRINTVVPVRLLSSFKRSIGEQLCFEALISVYGATPPEQEPANIDMKHSVLDVLIDSWISVSSSAIYGLPDL